MNEVDWFENLDGGGAAWLRHPVGDCNVPTSLVAADLDGDLDQDIAVASYGDDRVIWFENLIGNGTSWDLHLVDHIQEDRAMSVWPADVDGDEHADLIAAFEGGDIYWYRNLDGSGTGWERITVDDQLTVAAYCVYAEDMDQDDDVDILGAGYWSGDQLRWYENTLGDGSFWIEHSIAGALPGACSLHPGDLDGDADIDLVASADYVTYGTVGLRWFENTDGAGLSWTEQMVDIDFRGYDSDRTVSAADLDRDGDLDVCAANWNGNETAWWANEDGAGTQWGKHVLGNLESDYAVHVADINGDQFPDVAGVSHGDHTGTIGWWAIFGYGRGEVISSILDTGEAASWGAINWTSDAPDQTIVRFLVRSSNDPWLMGSWSQEITSPGSLEGILPDGDRYVQYMALLATDDPLTTPTLHDVTIDWHPLAEVESEPEDSVREGGGVLAPIGNPVRSDAEIAFRIPERTRVELQLLDLEGRLLTTLASGELAAGDYRAAVPALPAGVYLCRLASGEQVTTRKLVVVE